MSWFRKFHAQKNSWPSPTSNLRLRVELQAKKTRTRPEVPSSTGTKMLRDQLDLSKLSESKRNNSRSRTRSWDRVLKPTSRTVRTPELKQPMLRLTATVSTLLLVLQTQNQVSEEKLKGILTPHLYYEQIEWGKRGCQIGMRPRNLHPVLIIILIDELWLTVQTIYLFLSYTSS